MDCLLSPATLLAATPPTPAYTGLTALDGLVVLAYLIVSLLIGIAFTKRSRKSLADFFASSGSIPWWLLGTSMIATSFAADTPLALSGLLYAQGISGNWFWWCGAMTTMAGVFFYARLWRRAALVTDNQFVYLRYHGKPAHVLRGFRAVYFSLIYATIVLGWVNLALVKIVIGLVEPHEWAWPLVDRPVESILRSTGYLPENPLIVLGTDSETGDQPWTVELHRRGNVADLVARREGGGLAEIALGSDLTIGQLRDSIDALPGLAAEIPSASATPETTVSTAWIALPPTVIDEPIALTRLGARSGKPGVTFAEAGIALRRDQYTESEIAWHVLTVKVLVLCFIITTTYCAMGGLWGVVVTDFFQFFLAMGGCVYLAWVAVAHFGGLGGMWTEMSNTFGPARAAAMSGMWPAASTAAELQVSIQSNPGTAGAILMPNAMTWSKTLMYLLVVWYALGFTDGGSYLAQRMIAAKSERDAALGYLSYAIGHFAVRLWPWILVGAAGAILFPTLAAQQEMRPQLRAHDPEMSYILVMRTFLSPGWMGLMVSAFLAAYMSTVSSHVNLAAGYLVNDLYKPFIKPSADEKHLIRVSTVATLLVALAGALVTLWMNSIVGAWFLLASINAGIGIVYLLRWYWWRISAWSELSCFAAVAVLTLTFAVLNWGNSFHNGLEKPVSPSRLELAAWKIFDAAPTLEGAVAWANRQVTFSSVSTAPREGAEPLVSTTTVRLTEFPFSYLMLVPGSIVVWLTVTLLTRPVPNDKLVAFYRRVRPGGPGWRHIAVQCPEIDASETLLNRRNIACWLLSTVGLYAAIFATHAGFMLSGVAFMGWGIVVAGCALALRALMSPTSPAMAPKTPPPPAEGNPLASMPREPQTQAQ